MLDDDDMSAPPEEPDSGTPADQAAGSNDDGTDLGAGKAADDEDNDPTTETEDDPRLA